MLNYVESLEYISSAAARVAPDLLKALKILSETTVRRSAGDREDQKIRKIRLYSFRMIFSNLTKLMKILTRKTLLHLCQFSRSTGSIKVFR